MIRKPFLRTLAACLLSAPSANAWETSPCETTFAAAGGAFTLAKKTANCRPISYQEREQIWRDAVERENATRKKGCQNGELGKAALAVLHCLLFDFINMKTGVCFPRVRTLQERLQPWYSRASIFRALDRLEAAGVLQRVHRRMRNAGKVVQGATLYVFGRITEAEKTMVRKVGRSPRPRRARSGRCYGLGVHQSLRSAPVPSENLIF